MTSPVYAPMLSLLLSACRMDAAALAALPDAGDGGAEPADAGAPPSSCDAAVTWADAPHRAWTTDDGAHYAYAPSIVVDGDLVRVFSCRNADPYVVRDHIFYAESDGGVPSAPRLVFGPGDAGRWDSYHVCDPSIVRGHFGLGGQSYAYAMFYTGNDQNGIGHCQLGLALSENLDRGGAWTRTSLPIVAHPDDGTWGVGQPAAINLDGGSRVLLFYTRADPSPHVYVRDADLSDAEHPRLGPEVRVSEDGLTTTDGGPDVLTNVDVVVDRARELLYVVSERHPLPSAPPAGIASSLVIASLPISDALAGRGTWNIASLADENLTGSPRNHNAGLARLDDGALSSVGMLRLFTSTMCATCDVNSWLFHVGIVEVTGSLCAPGD